MLLEITSSWNSSILQPSLSVIFCFVFCNFFLSKQIHDCIAKPSFCHSTEASLIWTSDHPSSSFLSCHSIYLFIAGRGSIGTESLTAHTSSYFVVLSSKSSKLKKGFCPARLSTNKTDGAGLARKHLSYGLYFHAVWTDKLVVKFIVCYFCWFFKKFHRVSC
jgi:hypothetical protein